MLVRFLSDIWANWVTRVIAAVSVASTIATVFHSSVPNTAFWIMGYGCLLFAWFWSMRSVYLKQDGRQVRLRLKAFIREGESLLERVLAKPVVDTLGTFSDVEHWRGLVVEFVNKEIPENAEQFTKELENRTIEPESRVRGMLAVLKDVVAE